MDVEFTLNNSKDPKARFVSWAPSPCQIRVTDPAGAPVPGAIVRIAGTSAAGGGAIVFRTDTGGPFSSSVTITANASGVGGPFFVAGKFGSPSTKNGDVSIRATIGPNFAGNLPVMVRIRKNANKLTREERDRFVDAFAKLNNRGTGPFRNFRDMHTAASLLQAHRAPGFLPWHRAYLLDLERFLQAIDPSVALPYWRFDQPAPNIFTKDFLGASDSNGTVQFSPTNPLQFWATDGVQGINRRPLFPTNTAPPNLLNESQTLGLGTVYKAFRTMEGNPHGWAHGSFGGSISDIATAAKDPLFFLLHCNVDRLWAKWQRQFGRLNYNNDASFDSTTPPGGNRIGHNLADTMWPWNGITGGSRPPTAPGGPMPPGPTVTAPGSKPKVQDTIDYHGGVAGQSNLGFDYDDVAFMRS